MKKIEELLVKKFEEIAKWAEGSGFAGFSCTKTGKDWFLAFMKWKKDINFLITEWNKEQFINQSTKWFLFLGYVPRASQNIFVCSCVLYHLIKRINNNVSMLIMNDGSLVGTLKNEKKINICLNAHMDVVVLDDNIDNQHYGVFGKKPNVVLESSWNGQELNINKNNDSTVLGADDGKGIVTILSVLANAKNNNELPNLTFLITSIEEAPFGFSARRFASRQNNYNLIFPKGKLTTMFINLDAYSGRECDLYSGFNKKKHWVQKHEENFIKFQTEYLKTNGWISTQDKCWINPPSDALILKNGITDKRKDYILFISLACNSINPHSNKENINLLELEKFNKWFNKNLNNF